MTLIKKDSLRVLYTSKEFLWLLFIISYGIIVAYLNIIADNGSISLLKNSLYHNIFGLMIMAIVLNINDLTIIKRLFSFITLGLIISIIYTTFFYKGIIDARIVGFFNNPNHLGFYCNVCTISVLFINNKYFKHVVKLIIIAIFTLIIYNTGSRSAGLLQFILIFIITYNLKNKYLAYVVFPVLAIFFLYAADFYSNEAINRRFSIENIITGSGRFDIIVSALKVASDHYFIGCGMGQYQYHHLSYVDANAYVTARVNALGTHNHYLDIFTNYGIICFFIYIYIYYSISKKIRQLYLKDLRLFLLLMFTSFLIVISSQAMHTFPLYWLSLATFIQLQKIYALQFKFK